MFRTDGGSNDNGDGTYLRGSSTPNVDPALIAAARKKYPQLEGATDEQVAALIRQSQNQTPKGESGTPSPGAALKALAAKKALEAGASLFAGGEGAAAAGAAGEVGGAAAAGAAGEIGTGAAAVNMSASLPGVGAGAYTGYLQGKGVQNAVKGKKLSTEQQVALALPTFGGSFLANKFMKDDKWKTEGKRLVSLKDVAGWRDLASQPGSAANLTGGRSKDELVALENAKVANGEYGNPEFAASRDESKLKGKDVWGYATFGEKFGDKWLGPGGFTADQREKIGQAAVDTGAFREHHGTGDLSENADFDAKVAEILAKPAPVESEITARPKQKAKPKQSKPKTPSAPTVNLSDLIPQFSQHKPTPEVDDVQTPEEAAAVGGYRQMIENFAKRRELYGG